MNFRIITCAIIWDGTKVLLGRKKPGVGPYPDTWHIPGGGVELGNESCDDAMLREIREETSLEVKNLRKSYWNTDEEPNKRGELTRYVFLVYECDLAGGSLKPDDDLVHLEWVEKDRLRELPLTRPSAVWFRQFGYIPS